MADDERDGEMFEADHWRAELDDERAPRPDCIGPFKVADVSGVGTDYTIWARASHEPDRFSVEVSSGPVHRVVAERLTWVAAMSVVRDAVLGELDAEQTPVEPVEHPGWAVVRRVRRSLDTHHVYMLDVDERRALVELVDELDPERS
jgi:hypothetical protein